MFSPEFLRDVADRAQALLEQLAKDHPPGTVHQGRNEAHDTVLKARICADWMDAQGIEGLPHVGPFSILSKGLSRGQRVRVKKGARVFSTRPGANASGTVSVRSQVITVREFYEGYIDFSAVPLKVVNPWVQWAGAGGYWRRTDLANIELIS